jgi:hypothetical protein
VAGNGARPGPSGPPMALAPVNVPLSPVTPCRVEGSAVALLADPELAGDADRPLAGLALQPDLVATVRQLRDVERLPGLVLLVGVAPPDRQRLPDPQGVGAAGRVEPGAVGTALRIVEGDCLRLFATWLASPEISR